MLSAAFSPDGRYVVTASEDSTARLWETETGKPIALLEGHKGCGTKRRLQPGWPARGDRVRRQHGASVGSPQTGKLIVLARRCIRARWYRAAFSPDSRRVVTASWDSTARVWEAETGKLIARLEGHTAPVLQRRLQPGWPACGDRVFRQHGALWEAETGS